MNKKETKLTSVPSYAFAVLLVSGIFLYIALALGDVFNLFDISHVVSRYIPCFIAGIIGVFVIAYYSKCFHLELVDFFK